MRSGSILYECAVILAVAGILGTGVHLLRTDEKQRIAWVGNYPNPYRPMPPPQVAPTPPPPVEGGDPPTEATIIRTGGVKDPPPAPPPPKPVASGPVREIHADEAKALHEEGSIPFLDARRTRDWERSRIPAARPFSVWETAELDQKISGLLEEFALEHTLVVYCQSGDCEDSHNLAERLKTAGYKDIRVFRGGFPEWTKRRWPVEKADGTVGPLEQPVEPEPEAEKHK